MEAYNVPAIPDAKSKAVKVKIEPIVGDVQAGKEWKTEWRKDGTVESNKVGSDNPASPSLVVLDGYDQAFLSEVIGEKWSKDESRAKVMKWHWLRNESAAAIEKYHTTTDGRLERGYSERMAADYIKAFFAADNRREHDGKTRQRPAPVTTPPSNQVEW